MAILTHMFSNQGPLGIGRNMSIKHGAASRFGRHRAAGGAADDSSVGEPTPINAAGGEFVVPPHIVEQIGGGDIKRGHQILDEWVMSRRKDHIKTLKGLPGPAKS
jgi:hypothetical protein